MKDKNKKPFAMISLAVCMLIGYWLWLLLRPVEVVAVHQENNYSDVLVKNFPFTTQGKINWWSKNKKMLKEKYGIPQPASYGSFTIIFWYFGVGYKEEGKYDRLCFYEMKKKENCIEKERAFEVSYSKSMGTTFTVHDGIYRIGSNGEIIKNNPD